MSIVWLILLSGGNFAFANLCGNGIPWDANFINWEMQVEECDNGIFNGKIYDCRSDCTLCPAGQQLLGDGSNRCLSISGLDPNSPACINNGGGDGALSNAPNWMCVQGIGSSFPWCGLGHTTALQECDGAGKFQSSVGFFGGADGNDLCCKNGWLKDKFGRCPATVWRCSGNVWLWFNVKPNRDQPATQCSGETPLAGTYTDGAEVCRIEEPPHHLCLDLNGNAGAVYSNEPIACNNVPSSSCDSNRTPTQNYRCQGWVSQREYTRASCNPSTSEWRAEGSACNAPLCGSAAKNYSTSDTSFGWDTLCAVGTVVSTPPFPALGQSSTWTCDFNSQTTSCTATRSGCPVGQIAQGNSCVSISYTRYTCQTNGDWLSVATEINPSSSTDYNPGNTSPWYAPGTSFSLLNPRIKIAFV